MQYLRAYLAAFVSFFVLDVIWLTVIAFEIFQSEVGGILRAEPNLLAAGAFYLLYIFGLLILVIKPAIQQVSMASAAWRGAVLGVTAYGTFDLTSLTVIQGWTIKAAGIDMIWGLAGTSLAAVVGFLAAGRAKN